MGRSLRFGQAGYGGLVLLFVFALSSCATEQSGPTGEEDAAKPVTREVTKTVTVAEAPGEEAAPATTPPPAAAQEESPEDVLALQYSFINAGDYEGAYALFTEGSKQLVSPEQYRAYFEANAPYFITDYSFPAVDVQGDAAIVEAALTANGASGQESYQRAQQLLREGGAWRVVIRDEQASSFAAAGQYGQQYQYDPNLPNPNLPNPNLPNPNLPDPDRRSRDVPDLPDFDFGGGRRGWF